MYYDGSKNPDLLAAKKTLFFKVRNSSLVATHLVVVVFVRVTSSIKAVTSNPIGMPFDRIVPRVSNTRRLTESDFD